ncbi:right-handed parallel beta-helix repeat-containing protein [Rhodocaloribacter sp.]
MRTRSILFPLFLFVLHLLLPAAHAQFVVNSTGQDGDGNLGDGICDTGFGQNLTGECTFQAALDEANARSGADVIHFNIPGTGPHVIQSASFSDFTISETVEIDGYTQPGAVPNTNPAGQGLNAQPMIVLSNTGSGPSIIIGSNAPGTVIRGLVFQNFGAQTFGTALISFAEGVRIEGCFIGTDAAGTVAVPNGQGLQISGANSVIGGLDPEDRNLISGNTGSAVLITEEAPGTVVQGNLIGTDVTGTLALGNGGGGLSIDADNVVVGGADPGAPNVISANDFGGVNISFTADDDVVQGNYIGTDVTGTVALGNDRYGLGLSGTGHRIGGMNPGEANVFAASTGDGYGIQITQGAFDAPEPTDIVIEGNYLGTNAGGDDLANAGDGIWIQDAAGITIRANTIVNNDGNGVLLRDFGASSPQGVEITENSIYDNDGLGIELGDDDGVTPNDSLDVDEGPNGFQNFPVITSASGTTVEGSLDSEPNQTYRIEFFNNDAFDPTGFGEGRTFVGSVEVTTDTDGKATFTHTLGAPSQNLTATATNLATGSTSEFSGQERFVVNTTGDASDQFPGDRACDTGNTITRGSTTEPECTLRAAIEEINALEEPFAIHFDIPSLFDFGCDAQTSVCTIAPQAALPDLTVTMTIDGYTQPGARANTVAVTEQEKPGLDTELKIVLDGVNAGSASGLVVKADGVVIRGLAIGHFSQHGIHIVGDNLDFDLVSDVRIEGNFIGTDVTGSQAATNQLDGVRIEVGSANVIGGTDPAARNLISGNGLLESGGGIRITNTSVNNQVLNNLIGTNIGGTSALPNAAYGIRIDGENTSGNEITDNLISGNGSSVPLGTSCVGPGAKVDDDAWENTFTDNFVGVDGSGNAALGNKAGFCLFEPGPSNVLEGNVISGNESKGVWGQSQTDVTGIVGDATRLSGNIIGLGLDPLQSIALPNEGDGIRLEGFRHAVVEDNMVGYNKGHGLLLTASASHVADQAGVTGNTFFANDDYGISITGADSSEVSNNSVGTDAVAGDLPNGAGGINVQDSPGVTMDMNVVVVGTGHGVSITGAKSTGVSITGGTIAGSDDASGSGVYIENASGAKVSGVSIENFSGGGVQVKDSPDVNLEANDIVVKGGHGVSITGAKSTGVSITGGTIAGSDDASGSGVYIENASGAKISDLLIKDFGNDGVTIVEKDGGMARENTVTRTVFQGLGDLYIDLGDDGFGKGLNDPLDGDDGPNRLQNNPDAVALIDAAGDVQVYYTVDTDPLHADYPLTIEFSNNVSGAGGFFIDDLYQADVARKERKFTLGSAAALGVRADDLLSITATDAKGNTSEVAFAYVDSSSVAGLEYGDAPETGTDQDPTPHGYPTTLANDGARHEAVFSIRLGDRLDPEADGKPAILVDGDDLDADDDDDGILFGTPQIFPHPVLGPGTQPLPVLSPGLQTLVALNSVSGYLNAWIDFNRDGDWDDPDEHVVDEVFVGTGPVRPEVSFTVPASLPDGLSVMRVRFTTVADAADTVTGLAPDGEVEDYLVQLLPGGTAIDYGDAPDDRDAPRYPTLLGATLTPPAAHVLSELVLGEKIDGETDGRPDEDAAGDGDDDDGVTFTTPLLPGQTATVAVTVTNAAGGSGYLNAWLDFNRDDDWDDPGEQIFTDETLAPGTHTLTFTVPDTALTGKTYARFRLDPQGGLGPAGLVFGGEVEDYAVTVGTATPVEPEAVAPSASRLYPNYPNPFARHTTIPYDVAAAAHVRVEVFDLLGRRRVTLVDAPRAPGRYEARLDAAGLPAGVYVVRLTVEDFRAFRTLTVVR